MPAALLEPAVRTDVGRRSNNEDSVFATAQLAVVADGVGGAASGEIASRLVVDTFISLEKSRLTVPIEAALLAAVQDANARIAFVAACRPEHAGMASTVTAIAATNDGRLLIANVGDSRTYLLRGGRLKQLTRDDSLVQELLDQGAITPGVARTHPGRSVVTSVLGGGTPLDARIAEIRVQVGDRALLCSDGLSDVLDDAEIARLLRAHDRETCAQRLVETALAAGGRDNISVVVADVKAASDSSACWLTAL